MAQFPLKNGLIQGTLAGTPTSGTLDLSSLTLTVPVSALRIGTSVQAYDADLTTWAGVTPGAGVATALAIAPNAAGGFTTTDGTATLTNKTIAGATISANVTVNDLVRFYFDGTNAELYFAADIHGAGRDAIILSAQDSIVFACGANSAKTGYFQMGTSSATYEHFRWQHNGVATVVDQTPGSKKHIFASYYWSGGVGTNYRAMAMRPRTSAAGVGTIDFYSNDPVTSGELDNGTFIFGIREGEGAYFPTGYGVTFQDGNTIRTSAGRVQIGGVNAVTISSADTLTNKTISGASNTITNVSLASGVTGTLPVASGGTAGTTQTTALAGIGVSTVFKAADTSRASTTTRTADPDLTVSLPVGVWRVKTNCVFSNGSAVPNEYVQLVFSGTQTIAAGIITYGAHAAAAVFGSYPNSSDASILAPVIGVAGQNASICHDFVIKVTVTGTLSVNWAQALSDAANTTMKAGSYMDIRRIAE